MSHVPGNETNGTPVRDAARWFARLRGTDTAELRAEDQAEWEQWSANPRHIEQLVEIEALWRSLEALPAPAAPTAAELTADDYDGSMPIREWQRTHAAPGARWRFGPSMRRLALAACVVAFVAIPALLWRNPLTVPPAREHVQSYVAPQGENRTIVLPDRSTLTLGARTEVSTHYTASRRVVVLERGEAWFSVSHDPNRPFTVLAGGGAITALGTQFNVRRELDVASDRVTVIVSSGAVEVAPSSVALPEAQVDIEAPATAGAATPWHATKLVKGQAVTYDTQGTRGGVQSADLEAAEAWKEGRLEYRHEPLKFVIPQINRYSAKPIVLADAAAGDIEFSGTVFQGQVEDWVRAVATAFPVEVTETDHQIFIRARSDAGAPRAPDRN